MSDDGPNLPKAEGAPAEEHTYHYIKSPQCVDLPVHGAFGGIDTKTGRLFMSVFAERPPIPQEIHYAADRTTELSRIGKQGIIRSVNAVMHFDINTAIAVRKWLDDRIRSFERDNPELVKANPEAFKS